MIMKYDLKIQGRALITMNPSRNVIENGVMLIRNGIIEEVGPAEKYINVEAQKTLDCPHCLVMPGLINTHTHAPMSCFRGIADDLPLIRWLEDYIFPAESRFLDPDLAYWGTLLSAAEMTLSGTTCFADGYFFESDVARAVEKSGLRAVLAQGIIDFPAPGVPNPARNIDIAEEFIQEWKGRSARIQPALFCHSPYTCSPETLRKSKQTARRLETLFFIHLAEVRTEIDTIQKDHGTTPALYLDSLGILDGHTVAIHCIWLNGRDMEVIAARETKVSHTPESAMKLASGVPPVIELLEHGVTVSLGTDGCASNNDLDMFQEMDVATKLQKIHRLNPTVLPAEEVVWMSTMGGAKALGLEQQIGSLEKGKRADIILVNIRKPHLMPLYDYYSQIVYAAKGSDVETVIVGGEIILENRTLVRLDIDEVLSRVISIAASVKKGLKG